MLICPVCAERLTEYGGSFACPRGHSFDAAREGYVNLLVGGVRGAAGDTKEMLRARRTFLERGFYAPLSEQLNAMAVEVLSPDGRSRQRPYSGKRRTSVLAPAPENLTPSPSPCAERGAVDAAAATEGVGALPAAPTLSAPARRLVVDAGCGEGYYLGRLRAALDARLGAGALAYLGVDIAKDAARLAARRYPDMRFAVADVKRGLPVETGSVALLLNVFAPRNPAEFARVVAPGGIVLVALPGPVHLSELRERYRLIGIEPEKARHVEAQLEEAFALAGSAEVAYEMDLSADDVRQLLTMTPNARHRERQGWRDAAPEPARVTASFVALAFRRHRETAQV